MTAAVIIAGLLPIMWSTGTGSDVMKRIAAPMVGGVVTSVLMELLVFPVIYEFMHQKGLSRTDDRTSLKAGRSHIPGQGS
jgi:Cu(I)/Ag(I) efflux system membrane protein CusA/SilA